MFKLAHLSDPHLGPLAGFSLHQLFGKRATGYVNWRPVSYTHLDVYKRQMTDSATKALQGLDRILKALAIDPERALEELNSDWTASQELADVLMRKYKLPFRAGHHFASEAVSYTHLDVYKRQP